MLTAAVRLATRRSVSQSLRQPTTLRLFSSSTPTTPTNPTVVEDDDEDNFEPSPPDKLTVEMAEGIADTTHFYIRHGTSNQRLRSLAQATEMPVVTKWQKMMQVFLLTQVHVISGLGYTADEQGLTKYAQDLAQCIQQADETMQALFAETRRDTWRELVATCFQIPVEDIPTLSIVDARNLMHKVSSKMIEPDLLMRIQSEAAQVSNPDPEMEVALKHKVLQDIIVNSVYLGGNPSLVEEAGFGNGPEAYAKVQCAMSDHEGDPLIAQYATSAMIKIWQAAGLDMSSIQPGDGV